MSQTLDAFLRSWPSSPWLAAGLLVSAAIYGRGWITLHRRDPDRWHSGKLAAYLGGLATLFLAFGSPIESFGSLLLQVHMIQHMLLMMVAPPLIWLGSPMFPMIRGIPRPIRIYWLEPVLRSQKVRGVFASLSKPLTALVLYLAATWIWHVPAVYEAALRSSELHRLQHFCFLGSSLLFWYLVVRPYPFRPRWSAWLLLPYLLIADVSNTVLSALLTFSDRVIYPHYGQIPRIAGISALDDQATAGVIMWVPGSIGFLLPLFLIGIRLLFGGSQAVQAVPRSPSMGGFPILPILQTTPPRGSFDLLRMPIAGRFLRWRHARLAIQLVTTGLAIVVIADGFSGPQVSSMNLAGVLPWIHWRGLLVLGLLAVGNISCMACPFLVPRTLARRWLPAGLAWPRRLRSKWLAVGLVALFFWSYEAFSLWDRPRATAWIVVGYFGLAFAIDGIFRGASFCKYLCPIGQFNFVQSLVSPLEVRVKDESVCGKCRTKECIRGSEAGLRGCELELYLPRKAGNLDCTLCLDCVHACPHENIGILSAIPGRDLWNDSNHSGIGRLKDRPDLAALILVLVVAAFANAGGMVAPVQDWQERLTSLMGLPSTLVITTVYYVVALVVVPLLAFGLASAFDRRSLDDGSKWWESATRFSYSLVPLGFAMWLSHYGFHLLTSYQTVIPTAQRFVAGLGWHFLGKPEWTDACCRPVAEWLPRLEIVCLDLGLLLSLYSGYRIASGRTPTAWKAFVPWIIFIVFLFATGVWIVLQPMQMRGTMVRPG
jgi:cytochrome c oxidase assembly factor CtaG/polyferredoxin